MPLIELSVTEVRHRGEDVVDLTAGGRQGGIGAGRVGHEQGRVAHQAALADDLVEGAAPRPSKVDVVVRDPAVPLA